MFEDRKIIIKAYNIETVLSEKLETIIVRGTTNTRMRDFYDIYTLLSFLINPAYNGITQKILIPHIPRITK